MDTREDLLTLKTLCRTQRFAERKATVRLVRIISREVWKANKKLQPRSRRVRTPKEIKSGVERFKVFEGSGEYDSLLLSIFTYLKNAKNVKSFSRTSSLTVHYSRGLMVRDKESIISPLVLRLIPELLGRMGVGATVSTFCMEAEAQGLRIG